LVTQDLFLSTASSPSPATATTDTATAAPATTTTTAAATTATTRLAEEVCGVECTMVCWLAESVCGAGLTMDGGFSSHHRAVSNKQTNKQIMQIKPREWSYLLFVLELQVPCNTKFKRKIVWHVTVSAVLSMGVHAVGYHSSRASRSVASRGWLRAWLTTVHFHVVHAISYKSSRAGLHGIFVVIIRRDDEDNRG
jgi:hypothetical protein